MIGPSLLARLTQEPEVPGSTLGPTTYFRCPILTANKDNINGLLHADALYSGSVSVIQPELIRSSDCDDHVRFVSYWRNYVHEVLVNRLGRLSLPRKSVVRLTDRPDMTLDVYRGRKTTMQQQPCTISFRIVSANINYEYIKLSPLVYITRPKYKCQILLQLDPFPFWRYPPPSPEKSKPF